MLSHGVSDMSISFSTAAKDFVQIGEKGGGDGEPSLTTGPFSTAAKDCV